jgi:hypothetical protein
MVRHGGDREWREWNGTRMWDHDLTSLSAGLAGLLRVGAAALVLFIIGSGIALVRKPIHRMLLYGAVLLIAMSATHFARTHRCVGGEVDTDESGREFYRCTEWLPRRDAYAIEVTLGVGVACAMGFALMVLWTERDKVLRLVGEMEQRLRIVEAQTARSDSGSGPDDEMG